MEPLTRYGFDANGNLRCDGRFYMPDVDGNSFYKVNEVDAALAALRAEVEAVQSRMASEYEMDMNDQIRKNQALKAELAQVTAERDEMKYRLQVHADLIGETEHGLRQQLATAQNELCTAQDQIPPDMDGDSLSVALIKLVDARRNLQQQLADLKAERESQP